MTRGVIAARLVAAIEPTLAPLCLPSARCVATTAIGVEVLARFNIAAEPLTVALCVHDGSRRFRVPRHVVVRVPALAMLLDLDLQQCRRPDFWSANLPAAVALDWHGTPAVYALSPDGPWLDYQPTPADQFWATWPDWTERARWAAVVDALVGAITSKAVVALSAPTVAMGARP